MTKLLQYTRIFLFTPHSHGGRKCDVFGAGHQKRCFGARHQMMIRGPLKRPTGLVPGTSQTARSSGTKSGTKRPHFPLRPSLIFDQIPCEARVNNIRTAHTHTHNLARTPSICFFTDNIQVLHHVHSFAHRQQQKINYTQHRILCSQDYTYS